MLVVLKRWLDPRTPLRPPGAGSREEFVRRCIKCSKCAQVCPHDSIVMGGLDTGVHFGTPMVIPRDTPCYLCMECPPVCPSGALDNDLADKRSVRMGLAVLDEDRCLAYAGVICRACFQQCPIYREAITMREEMYPVVHPEACTGCGVCEHVCIADPAAITVRSAAGARGRRGDLGRIEALA
jgi:MauM/NapG family ferredoxin protein